MDCAPVSNKTKYTNYALIASLFFAVGSIINYFHENYTFAKTKTSVIHHVITLPPDSLTQNKSLMYTAVFTVRPRDTLASIFYRAGLPSTLWMKMLDTPGSSRFLENLRPGNTMQLTVSQSHQLISLSYKVNLEQSYIMQKINNHWSGRLLQKPVTKTVAFSSSIVHGTLTNTTKATGLPVELQKQVDAMLSRYAVHPGDRLEVLYHEYFVGDQKDRPGNVIAAEIIDGKNKYRMVRFKENNRTGYYTPNGSSTDPQFLISPLNYQRIGSQFSYDRLDPFTHRVQPHLGVDYDAPAGTPVKALGNGIIVFCKRMNGYGNVIMVRYNKTYKSFYAHLEKFSHNLHPNEPVEKGQVIGYVGTTGWSTGPHLHFAIYKNGVPVNPLTIKFPFSAPIEEKYRHQFFYDENRWFNEMTLFADAKKTISNR